ncbi:Calx-beta domain-containing protein [Gammaproteobacteria bacterium]|nr:Calx-beta domain-containing protein [Gammaproteobacteria bacterium]
MNKRLSLTTYFYISAFLIFSGLFSFQVHATGIASVNSYVEIKTSASDFRARKQSSSGQRSSSGYDFIITPERTNICQQGQSSSICTTTQSFSGSGYVPNGSATSIVFRNTPANSYLVFMNDDHSSGDRTSKIGQIVFDNEILGYWTTASKTVDFDYVDKSGATYPTSSNSGFNARATESHSHYGSSTSSSTTSGDWVSIGSDKRTLRIGVANGQKGDYIRVITKSANPTVDFNITSSSGAESVSSAALTVDLSSSSTQNVTVNYAITGTATGSGTDYTLANGTLTINAGATTGTITIASIVNDVLDEVNETVIVTLSSPSNATLGSDSVHTYTITDNDARPTLDFYTSTYNKAESNASQAVRVDLTAVSSQTVTVNYAVTGTATGSGTDYTLANGTLTIAAGAVVGYITIANIVDDSIDEGNETIILTLSSPTNAWISGTSVHTYTIADNDNRPQVDFNTTSSNGAESVSSKAITVDLSWQSSYNVTVNYAVTGTATGSGTDYTLANGTLTINALDTSGTINIGSIIDDSITEGNETVIVTLSGAVNSELGSDDVHTYTITDNESAPVVQFNNNGSNGFESVSSTAITVELSSASTQNVTVNYVVDGSVANAATGSGTDFTLGNGTLTIPAGATSGTITIAGIVDDGLDEVGERVVIRLSSPNNATLGTYQNHVYTIYDNDSPPVVDFNTTSSNGAESVSSKAITVDLSAVSGKNVTVNYAVTGSATGSTTDYTLANGTLTINAGATSGTITIASIVNDSLDEANETVIVTLSSPSAATLGSDRVHTYTINDNDNAPVVDFNTTSSNGAESVSSKAITVDLSAASGQNVTVNYAITGTATGSGTDFTLANGTLTINAGATTGTINIASIVNDSLDEANETIILTLSSPGNATLGSDDVHTYTITDNDNAPVVDFNTTSSNGAESVSSKAITVDLSAASSNNVTVNYAITGTATGSGTDFTLANGTLTINAGATSGTITIGSIADDSLDEVNETVIVTLSSPGNATLGSDDVHTYTITDNDNAPVVDFEATSSSGAESVSSKAITVDLSAVSSQNVTVNYAITGTASGSGTDFTLANGTLTINAGATTGTITIAGIVDDGDEEGNETVVLTLSNPGNATLGSDDVHTFTILEPLGASRTIAFADATSNGAESVSSKVVTIQMSSSTASNATVNYAITGTATGSGTDYTLANGTATIAAGATSTTITIAGIVDDSLDEANETIIITLSNPSNANPGSTLVHTYTITDNDNAPVVDFNTTSSNGAESVSSKAITVDLSAASGQNVTVNYAITGTATGSGTDFTLANGTLTINAGATSGTINISSIINDLIDEANETVIVTLSSPGNATLGSDRVHTYTITDNDNAPVVDFNATSSSGAESASSAGLTVDLSAASGQNVTVNYAITGTATGSGTDFTLANGTLTINAGETSGTITIASIANDSLDEANETVIVTLSSPGNATLGSDDVHTYTITDNDNAPVVDFETTSSNGAESVSSKAITVDLSAASGQNVTVNYTVTGTATGSGTDYTLANGTLTINAGATSGTITIGSIINDAADEANETVILTLSSPGNATLGSDDVHTYTINDNDDAPVVDFNTTSSSGAESASSASLTVDLSAVSSQNVTVNYAITGTATGSGTDYTLANGTLTIAAGETTGIITIAGIVNDSLDEANETVIVTLSSPNNATLGSDRVHTYTINDNDNTPTIDFNTTSSSGAESISSKAITVDLSGASSQNVTVNYAITGTATGSTTDYTLANGTLTINAGATTGTITIASIVNDSLDEANETVIVTLSSPSNATLGSDDAHTYTINDNDNAPVVDFNTTSSSGAESVSSKAITVDLSAVSAKNITVNYAVTGTASGSGNDYTLGSGTITINAGATTSTITIASIIDDSIDEADETVVLTLSNPSNATLGTDSAHTYTISDNDNTPTIDFNATSSNGAESVSSKAITIDLSGPSSEAITVNYTVTGTATGSGTDYSLVNGTITIAAGATTSTITIASIINDSADEADETVIITLSSPSNATLGSDDVHTYTITDDDGQPTVDFNTTTSTGAEDISSAALTVDLSAASSNNITVNYAVTGTATGSGTDYTLANGTLTINAGATSGTITIAGIVDDSSAEGSETVVLTLSGPSNAVLGNDSVHTYTISDNDGTPTVAFSSTSSADLESVSSRSLAVVIPFASDQDVVVNYSVTGGTAGSGTDYSLSAGTLTIDSGATSGTIVIPSIVDDSADEVDETIIVTLSNPTNATLGTDVVHTVTINDNDNPPVVDFNLTSSSGDEATSSKVITVDLSEISTKSITVNYSITGTATGSGEDYTLGSGAITINAGETTGSITIASIIDDSADEPDETIILTLSSPANATLGTDIAHTFTINDNDTTPVVDFSSSTSSAVESVTSAGITLELSAVSGQSVTVNYAVTGTASGSGTDYTLSSGTATINAGETTGTITISSIVNDLIKEANETVILTLSSPGNATLGSDDVHTYTITDDDSQPTVDFNTISSNGAESVSSKAITVDLSAVSSENVTVNYSVTGTAAGSGTDYTLANGSLTINAGSTSGIITIGNIVDDLLDEIDETVIVTLSSPANANLGTDIAHTYTINDNENAPAIGFDITTSSNDESVSSQAIVVNLSTISSKDITVNFAVTGTANGSGKDFTLANESITIKAGETSGTITITDIVDDLLDEANETVIVTLSNPINAILGSNNSHTYTINDNDNIPAIDFNITSSKGDEPSPSIIITVDVSEISGKKISVDYQLTGTANGSGIDYTLEDGTLIIDAGENTGTITIPSIIDDDFAEEDETIIITLSNPTNATLGNDYIYTHTISTNDEDKRPVLIATSPQDDSTRVPIDSDIILKFNKDVDCESGTINIESEDNSSSFAVSLPNQIVTGCGTDIITINLPIDLEHETQYYVLIENTVFDDLVGNSYTGISNKKEFNFKTPIVLTDPTLKQPVIDNAKAMTHIATRWVDRNIDVISKRMKISSRQGLRVNLNNKIIDSVKTIGVSKMDYSFVELPIVEFCTVDSSGPKTSLSKIIKVHLSKISPENIIVDFNVTGSTGKEIFSYGGGILQIDAGRQSATIAIDDIPQDRFGFIQGDRKIIVTLSESSNSLLGDNLLHTYTLTDDQKAWTDPSADQFCISDFDNPRSSATIIAKASSNLDTEVQSTQFNRSDESFVDTNPEIQNLNTNGARDQADDTQDLEQLKSTIKAWASDPVTVTADGELKEVLGNWSVWIDGEFGEFTLGKTKPRSRILDEKSFHIGIDKSLSDDGDLFGFALGLGEDRPADRNHDSHMESRNYSFSTYGKFDDGTDALQFIFGISKLEFNSDRLDGEELLRGQREANQVFGSLALIGSMNNQSNNWQISPYLRIDGSYTEFDQFSEMGGEAALTFDELTLSNAKASIGTDISYLFAGSKYNVMPYVTFEYGLDYSETSAQNMYYTVEGANRNYILELGDGMKAHNWEVDIGLMIETFAAMNTTIGCKWQGRSDYLSAYSSVTNNDISSAEICFLELMWNF